MKKIIAVILVIFLVLSNPSMEPIFFPDDNTDIFAGRAPDEFNHDVIHTPNGTREEASLEYTNLEPSNENAEETEHYPKASSTKHLSLENIYETTDPKLRSKKQVTLVLENPMENPDYYHQFGKVTTYQHLPFFQLDVTVDKLKKLQAFSDDDNIYYTSPTNMSVFNLGLSQADIDLTKGSSNSNNHFNRVGIDFLHSIGLTGNGVSIAILGDGIQPHNDLQHRGDNQSIILKKRSFIDIDLDLKPDPIYRTKNDYTFSTMIAGLITSNGILPSIAPKTQLIDVIIGSQNYFSLSWYLEAIDWIIEEHPDIVILPPINDFDVLDVLVKQCWDSGILPITMLDPSPYENRVSYQNLAKSSQVIITRGIDKMQRNGEVSTKDYNFHYGTNVDVFTPLDFVYLSNAVGYDYGFSHSLSLGTVAGVLALLKESFPNTSLGSMKMAIINGTTDIINNNSFSLLNGTSSYQFLQNKKIGVNSENFEIRSEPLSAFSKQIEFSGDTQSIINLTTENFPEKVSIILEDKGSGLFSIDISGEIEYSQTGLIVIMEDGKVVKKLKTIFRLLPSQSDTGKGMDAGETFENALPLNPYRKIYGYVYQDDPIDIYSFMVNKDGLYHFKTLKGYISKNINLVAFDGKNFSPVDISLGNSFWWFQQATLKLYSNTSYYLTISLDRNLVKEIYSFELLYLSSVGTDQWKIDVKEIFEHTHLSFEITIGGVLPSEIQGIEVVIAQYRSDYINGKYQFDRRWGDRICEWDESVQTCSEFFTMDFDGDLFANSNYDGRYIISDMTVTTSFGRYMVEDVYITQTYNHDDFDLDGYKIQKIEVDSIYSDKDAILPDLILIQLEIQNLNYDQLAGELLLVDGFGSEIAKYPFRRDNRDLHIFSFNVYPIDILSFGEIWIGKVRVWDIGIIPVFQNITNFLQQQFNSVEKFQIDHFFHHSSEDIVVGLTLNISLSNGFRTNLQMDNNQGQLEILGYYFKNHKSWVNSRFTRDFGTGFNIYLYWDIANLNYQLSGEEELIIVGKFKTTSTDLPAQYFKYHIQGNSSLEYNTPKIKLKRLIFDQSKTSHPVFQLQMINTQNYLIDIDVELIYRFSGDNWVRSVWTSTTFFGTTFLEFDLENISPTNMKQIDVLRIRVIEIESDFEFTFQVNQKFDWTFSIGLMSLYSIQENSPKIKKNEDGMVQDFVAMYELFAYNLSDIEDFRISVELEDHHGRDRYFVDEYIMESDENNLSRIISIDLLNLNEDYSLADYFPDDFVLVTFYIEYFREEFLIYSEESILQLTASFDMFAHSKSLSQVNINGLREYQTFPDPSNHFSGVEFNVEFELQGSIPSKIEFEFMVINGQLTRFFELKAFIDEFNLGSNQINARIKKFAFDKIYDSIMTLSSFNLKLTKAIVITKTFAITYYFDVNIAETFSMTNYDNSPIIQNWKSWIESNEDLNVLIINMEMRFTERGNYQFFSWIRVYDDYGADLFDDDSEMEWDLNSLKSPTETLVIKYYVGSILQEMGYGNLYLQLGFELREWDYDWWWGNWWEETINLEGLGYGSYLPDQNDEQPPKRGQNQPLFKIWINPLSVIIPLLLIPIIRKKYIFRSKK